MVAITVGVYRETAPGERRVALVPDLVSTVRALGLDVMVESGAGAAAWFADDDYTRAGADIVPRGELFRSADVLVGVQAPNVEFPDPFRNGQTLVALLRPTRIPFLIRRWADEGVTVISLDLVPHTLSGAYPVDAGVSQARIAGYRAVLLAAGLLSRCLSPWGSAAAVFAPVRVLVVGAGAAGLQAIDTARGLGAVVHAHDLRRRPREEITALGGTFLDLPDLRPAADDAEFVRALDTEQDALRRGLAAVLPLFDIVIAAVEPPSGPAPTLITTRAIRDMRPGSVVVDVTAGPPGGNVEAAEPDTTTLVGDQVTVIGAGNLAAQVPTTASTAYAHNVAALLERLTHGGSLTIDPTDPLQAAIVVTHHGSVLHAPTWQLILDAIAVAGLP
ncbi:NAD(P) transhydrogenase subunit alpha [Kitasatospora sp. NPDC050543]|uniref:NAD(P) transhydrogenase subunit alpha n=1 Tax=Kitasatospora sp. NPDC050543 TaxID=3364054 RepID=UPI0037B29CC3